MGLVNYSNISDGTSIDASDVNNPFNTIYNEFNGNIDTVNIKDSAVTTAKIAADAVTATKIDWASTGADGGIWWEELGRTTLGSNGDTISVTPIAARKYLLVLVSVIPTGGTIRPSVRFNNDTGNNYATRTSTNGGADSTAISQSAISTVSAANQLQQQQVQIVNIAAQEKIAIIHLVGNNTNGAGNAPGRTEVVAKWANTSDQITRIDIFNDGTGDFATGSEVVVLGHN